MVWHFMPFAITFSTAYGQNIIRCTKFCATIVLGTSSYVFMKEAIGADANQSRLSSSYYSVRALNSLTYPFLKLITDIQSCDY